jgi:hypothetical protein
VIGFRYAIHDAEGEDVGDFVTAVPNWSVGERFVTGDGRAFRILKIVPFDYESESETNGMWMVEPVE